MVAGWGRGGGVPSNGRLHSGINAPVMGTR